MLRDLAALTPPLVVGGAVLVAVLAFVRRQLGPASRRSADQDEADLADKTGNPAGADARGRGQRSDPGRSG